VVDCTTVGAVAGTFGTGVFDAAAGWGVKLLPDAPPAEGCPEFDIAAAPQSICPGWLALGINISVR
jgi:hypothetical protein